MSGERVRVLVAIIEGVEEAYEVQEAEFGRVYRWSPGYLVLECDCGERLSLSARKRRGDGKSGEGHRAPRSARYEVRKVGFGRVYKWRPESVLIECECGETASLTASETSCGGCGAKHGSLVRENSTERATERGLEGEQTAQP